MSDKAILTVVPLEHLRSGLTTIQIAGKVAFGSGDATSGNSRMLEFFHGLEKGIDVYIVPTHTPPNYPGQKRIAWVGRYLGYVNSIEGAHPAGMKYRPATTKKYATDNQGYWVLFWEVENLLELPPESHVKVSEFQSYKTKRYHKPEIPRGPTLVEPHEILTKMVKK
jgi:hypothetical protein